MTKMWVTSVIYLDKNHDNFAKNIQSLNKCCHGVLVPCVAVNMKIHITQLYSERSAVYIQHMAVVIAFALAFILTQKWNQLQY